MRVESKIRFDGQTVTKTFDGDVEREFHKSELLWEIGREFNFLYPKPLRLDAKSKRIKFHQITESESIRSDYIAFMTARDVQEEDVRGVFEHAGRVLGLIHRELLLPDKRDWTPSETFAAAAFKAGCPNFESLVATLPHAFLHCDYGLENLERIGTMDEPQLVVFDASPNYFATFHANTFGPVYVDIGNFLSVLCGMVSLKYYPFFKWRRVAILQRMFLDGYTQTSGIECNSKVAGIFSYASASSYLHKKYQQAYLHDVAMWLLFNRRKGLQVQ